MSYQPPKSAEELLRRYAAGERNFYDVELDPADSNGNWPDFSDVNLENIVFHDSFISGSFRGACLRNAIFHCNVKGSDFEEADLRNSSFVGCAICGTSFKGANLQGANFAGAFYHGNEYKEGELPQ